MRAEATRSEVQRLLRQTPFRRFALSLENGDRIVIEQSGGHCFRSRVNGSEGSSDFYVISGRRRISSTFEAVASVALLDTTEHVA